MRLSRKMGLLGGQKSSLAELFADATLIDDVITGSNASTADYVSLIFPTSSYSNMPIYILLFHSEGYNIGKVYNSTYTKFIGDATITVSTRYSSYYVTPTDGIRDGTMAAVTFPHFSEVEADTILAGVHQQSIYTGHGSSSSTRYVNNTVFTGGGLYVVAHGSNFNMSISTENDLFTPIFSCTDGGTPNIVYLYRDGEKTYLSATGAAATKVYGGRISRLY